MEFHIFYFLRTYTNSFLKFFIVRFFFLLYFFLHSILLICNNSLRNFKSFIISSILCVGIFFKHHIGNNLSKVKNVYNYVNIKVFY